MSSNDPKEAHQPDEDVTLFLEPRALCSNHPGVFFTGHRKKEDVPKKKIATRDFKLL
jgi:hypothetical protein